MFTSSSASVDTIGSASVVYRRQVGPAATMGRTQTVTNGGRRAEGTGKSTPQKKSQMKGTEVVSHSIVYSCSQL